MDELTLIKIINKIKKGKIKDFEKIIDAYEHKVYGFIYSIVKDKHDTEDLTQDVFIKVYKHIENIDVTRNFSSWMMTIARNTACDHLRKHAKLVVMDQVEVGIEASPEQDYIKNEFNSSVDDYVQKLPEHLRMLILMKYFEELSYKEIGFRRGLEVKTVKSQLYDARRKLMKMMDQEGVKIWTAR